MFSTLVALEVSACWLKRPLISPALFITFSSLLRCPSSYDGPSKESMAPRPAGLWIRGSISMLRWKSFLKQQYHWNQNEEISWRNNFRKQQQSKRNIWKGYLSFTSGNINAIVRSRGGCDNRSSRWLPSWLTFSHLTSSRDDLHLTTLPHNPIHGVSSSLRSKGPFGNHQNIPRKVSTRPILSHISLASQTTTRDSHHDCRERIGAHGTECGVEGSEKAFFFGSRRCRGYGWWWRAEMVEEIKGSYGEEITGVGGSFEENWFWLLRSFISFDPFVGKLWRRTTRKKFYSTIDYCAMRGKKMLKEIYLITVGIKSSAVLKQKYKCFWSRSHKSFVEWSLLYPKIDLRKTQVNRKCKHFLPRIFIFAKNYECHKNNHCNQSQ